MNVHERLIKALEHEEPDRVPTLAQVLERPFTRKVRRSLSFSKKIKIISMLDAALQVGFDAVWLHGGSVKFPKGGKPEVPKEILEKYNIKKYDKWGRTQKNGWYHDGVLKTPELLREWISYINQWEPMGNLFYSFYKLIWNRYKKKGLVTIPTGCSVAYGTWSMIGLNKFAYLTRKHKTLVADLAKALGRITKEIHKCFFEKGMDLVFICDDWALKERMMYNPKIWDEIVGPVYKDLANNAHKHGAKFLVHTDGNILDTMPYLVKTGADAIDPLEYESGVRLKPLKEKYGDKITLIGNISATYVLTFGSIEDTITATRQCIHDAAEGGGYILAAGSDILGTCKLENVNTMINTVKKYGVYPISK